MAQHHVYLTTNGRISMAGLNAKNVATVADAIHAVVTTVK
jgi:aspartate/tyrosine/aromatic aminotransferase